MYISAFVESIPAVDLITAAFEDMLQSSNVKIVGSPSIEQRNLSSVKHVVGASVSIRFRVMTEAEGKCQLLKSNVCPMIHDDSLTLLTPLDEEINLREDRIGILYEWNDVDESLKSCFAYQRVGVALHDVRPQFMEEVMVGIHLHPISEQPYLLITSSLRGGLLGLGLT